MILGEGNNLFSSRNVYFYDILNLFVAFRAVCLLCSINRSKYQSVKVIINVPKYLAYMLIGVTR